MSSIESQVLAVVAYSAQFNHPLTAEEVVDRWLTYRGFGRLDKQLVSKLKNKSAVNKALQSLSKKKLLIEKKKLFTLVDHQQSLAKRLKFPQVKRQKEPLVKELVSLAKKIPWVLGVVLTGSYAAGGAGEQDDVDFLIITQRDRLWLTRLVLLFYSWLRGRRPHLPGGDISHSWDLNFWLDETSLALPKSKQSVYEAYEILQTRWVLERDNIRERFYLANSWLKDWLHFWQDPEGRSKKSPAKGLDLLSWLDWLAFYLQIGYRQLRHGRQRAGKHSAFFHPLSTRENIIKNWRKLYKQVTK
jgi:predicted nucleotidyltransferase